MLEIDRRRRALLVLGHLTAKFHTTKPTEIAAAQAQTARSGRWWEQGCIIVLETDGTRTFVVDDVRHTPGDGRLLTQEQTDALIQIGIHRAIAPVHGIRMVRALESVCRWPTFHSLSDGMLDACGQRGGAHTDHQVRALALALWGDRDVGVPRADYDRGVRP